MFMHDPPVYSMRYPIAWDLAFISQQFLELCCQCSREFLITYFTAGIWNPFKETNPP